MHDAQLALKRFVAFSENGNVQEKYRLCNVIILNKTSNRAVTHTYKCMKTEVFYFKSDMHLRPMRFRILCTPTDSSGETQVMCSTILLCLFTSRYDINGSRLNYSTVSRNKFGYINM